ncbi:integrase catalytic domain-containing protein [Trichonephila clavipes]|nr:integrase catalytic domain-containing protein [Trichonephila clavipes]
MDMGSLEVQYKKESIENKELLEYEDLGYIREIKADGSGVAFYMPHHGVYRTEKSTTKLRTVLNASSPSTNGKSLNSIQLNGGLAREEIFPIMVHFRKHKTNKNIQVAYGTVSAPYLATRTLKQLAMNETNNFPLAAPVVLSDCYMDDILSGSESTEEVIELQHQLIEMFKTAMMHLHKWSEITSNLQEYAFLESDETKAQATRGLLATDHVILNHGQVMWTTPELAPPLLTTTPHQLEDVSALDRFNVHRCPTRRVFSGTGLELVTRQAKIRYLYHSATAATTYVLEVTLSQLHNTDELNLSQ